MKRLIFWFQMICLVHSLLAQNQKNFKFRFSPGILLEQHQAFALRNNKNFNYEYKRGIGANLMLLYSKDVFNQNATVEFGPSIGQFIFTTGSLKPNLFQQNQKNNHLMSTAGIHFSISTWTKEKLKRGSGFFVSATLGGGYAFIQHGHFNDSSNLYNNTKESSYYASIGANFWWFRKNAKVIPVLKIGFQYLRVSDKHFNGLVFV